MKSTLATTLIDSSFGTTLMQTEAGCEPGADSVAGPVTQPPGESASTSGFATSTLTGALRADVDRFALLADAVELLPLLAAAVRHGREVSLLLGDDVGQHALWLQPRVQRFRCELALLDLPAQRFRTLRVFRMDPGRIAAAGELACEGPLHALSWRTAMDGAHDMLLPEIAGPLRFRLAALSAAPPPALPPALRAAWTLLRRGPASRSELVAAAGSQADARRLLNALYLQGSLIATRRR